MKHRKLAYSISVAADVLDYFLVGFIPVAGDIVDFAAIGALVFLTGRIEYLAGVIETVPLLEVFPTFTATTIILDKELI